MQTLVFLSLNVCFDSLGRNRHLVSCCRLFHDAHVIQTRNGCNLQGVLAGKYDDLPEQAFYMVGGIEEVAQKAEKWPRIWLRTLQLTPDCACLYVALIV